MFFIIIIILLVIFLLVRFAATTIAYETAMDAIFQYAMQPTERNGDFDMSKEFKRMLPITSYFFQFWNWDMWTVIDKEYREKIRINYLYKTTK